MIYYGFTANVVLAVPQVGQTIQWTESGTNYSGIIRFVSDEGSPTALNYDVLFSAVDTVVPPQVGTSVSATSPFWSATVSVVIPPAAYIRHLDDAESGSAKVINVTSTAQDSALTEVASKSYADARALVVRTTKSTTTVTNTSNTVGVNVTGHSFSVLPSVMYQFRFIGLYQTSNVSAGAAFAFTGPASQYVSWSVGIRTGAAGTTHFYRASATVLTTVTGTAATTVPASATNYVWEIDGMFYPTVAGTLQLQCFAPNADGRTLTISPGSIGILTKIA